MSQTRLLIDDVVRRAISPVLKDRGFKRAGRNFRRPGPSGIGIVNVQASSWNSGADGQFTLNLGTYFPAAARLHGVYPVKDQPLASDCLVRTRIGSLLPDRSDLWWDIAPSTDRDEMTQELRRLLDDVALPWLDSVSNYSGARAFCERSRVFWWVAIFAALENDAAGATEALNLAIQEAGGEDSRTRLRAWGVEHGIASAALGSFAIVPHPIS